MRSRLSAEILVPIVFALTSCGFLLPTHDPLAGQIGVGIYSDVGPWPNESLILEIGPGAWGFAAGLGTGVATFDSEVPQRVRIFNPRDCSVLSTFTAEPGHRYEMRVETDSIEVVDVTQGAFANGPGLPDAEAGLCQA